MSPALAGGFLLPLIHQGSPNGEGKWGIKIRVHRLKDCFVMKVQRSVKCEGVYVCVCVCVSVSALHNLCSRYKLLWGLAVINFSSSSPKQRHGIFLSF